LCWQLFSSRHAFHAVAVNSLQMCNGHAGRP
jgi:L-amino acid N-acyltransferase YncA